MRQGIQQNLNESYLNTYTPQVNNLNVPTTWSHTEDQDVRQKEQDKKFKFSRN